MSSQRMLTFSMWEGLNTSEVFIRHTPITKRLSQESKTSVLHWIFSLTFIEPVFWMSLNHQFDG